MRSAEIKEMIRLAREENPSIEVFATSGMGPEPYLRCAESEQKTEAFATSLIELMEEFDLDGYDMDWENGVCENQKSFRTLLLALRKAGFGTRKTPRGRNLGLTAAVLVDASGYDNETS